MKMLTIVSIHHDVIESITAVPNEWGGITRKTVRTMSSTMRLSNGQELTRSKSYGYDASYDAEARRINLVWLSGNLAELNAQREAKAHVSIVKTKQERLISVRNTSFLVAGWLKESTSKRLATLLFVPSATLAVTLRLPGAKRAGFAIGRRYA